MYKRQARSFAIDTLTPPIFLEDDCSLELFTFFNNAGWGFVAGTNEFMDFEKAQRLYTTTNNNDVLGLILFFATVDVVGDGDVFVKIYEVDEATDGPGTLVGTSSPVKASEIAVDPMDIVPTLFTFETPPKVNGDEFFVSVDFSQLYGTQDTASLLMTDIPCGLENDTWELFGDGETWASWGDTTQSWGIASDLFMIAIVENNDGLSATKELVAGDKSIRMHDAFPNPATNELTIAYDLEISANVAIEIFSSNGQLLKHIDKSNLPPGNYREPISIEDLPSGTYIYGITTNMGRLMNKFTVGK